MGIGSAIITRMLQFNNENCINILIGMPYSQLNIINYLYRCFTRLTMIFVNKNNEAKTLNKIINYIK